MNEIALPCAVNVAQAYGIIENHFCIETTGAKISSQHVAEQLDWVEQLLFSFIRQLDLPHTELVENFLEDVECGLDVRYVHNGGHGRQWVIYNNNVPVFNLNDLVETLRVLLLNAICEACCLNNQDYSYVTRFMPHSIRRNVICGAAFISK